MKATVNLPIKCLNKFDRECDGFREEPTANSIVKGFCIFEVNGFCGADLKDFKKRTEKGEIS